MKTPPGLNKISIVLVDTKAPANIGSVARCMMNTGLQRLVLVNPPRDPQNEAARLAAGAERILHRAETFSSLTEALADQGFVLGTSRHRGRLRKNIRMPRDMACQVLPLLGRNSVSIVFGNEVNGLEQEHLALCHEFVSIPSSDAFPSLNLSHAVMVIAYELFLAALGPAVPEAPALAPYRDLEQFYAHLQATLQEAGFLDHERPERMMFSLRQLFGRARLEGRDVSILQGILSALDRKMRRPD